MDTESTLMVEWRKRHEEVHRASGMSKAFSFVGDGAIDPARWSEAANRPRVLFLTKECYVDEDMHLRDLILMWGGPKHQFWWNVCRWHQAVIQTRKHLDSSDQNPPRLDNSALTLRQSISQVAVVNLKKSNGRSRSAETDMHKHVERDFELLARQIKMLAPDVIICGGTWRFISRHDGFWHAMGCPDPWVVLRSTDPAVARGGRTAPLWIDYWHPAASKPAVKLFDELAAMYRKAIIASGE